MTNQKTILIILSIVIFVLLASNVFLGMKFISAQKDFQRIESALETQENQTRFNEKNLEFTKLFISKVLKAESEVDFETRLTLENAVRNLEDEQILSQWQKFVDSKTDDEAQIEVKNLLEILISKIQ